MRGDEVVVTGVGACCNLGDDLAEIEAALREGRGGVFSTYAAAVEDRRACTILARYEGDLSDEVLGISRAQGRFMGRASRVALKVSRVALAQSGLDSREMAIVAGSGTGDVDAHLEIAEKRQQGSRRVSPTIIPRLMASTVSANLANVLRTTGPSFTATAACAGGAYNILLAAQLIQTGQVDCALACGVEVVDPHFHAGFDSMRAYNAADNDAPYRASRPYAADREGFVFGEGGGALVLESRAHAEARGATVLAVLRGYGMSSDGQGQMVAPDWAGALNAMRRALKHARVDPSEVDYVNTHGTSTPMGDVTEVKALRACFDGRHVRYSSTKGYTGHLVSGAGALEAVFTIAMLRGGWVAPSVHATPLDPALEDYPPVVEPEAAALRTAVSNSFGFGGTNASLVFGRA